AGVAGDRQRLAGTQGGIEIVVGLRRTAFAARCLGHIGKQLETVIHFDLLAVAVAGFGAHNDGHGTLLGRLPKIGAPARRSVQLSRRISAESRTSAPNTRSRRPLVSTMGTEMVKQNSSVAQERYTAVMWLCS